MVEMATNTGDVARPSTGYDDVMEYRNANNSKIATVLEAVASEKHGIRYQDIGILAGKNGVTAHELVAIFDMIRADKLINAHKHPKGNVYMISAAGRERIEELRAPKDLPNFAGKDSLPDPDVVRGHSSAFAVVHKYPIQRKEENEPEDDSITERITPCITPRENPVLQPVIQPPEDDEEEEEDEDNIEPLPKGGAGGPCGHCGEPQRNGYAKRSHERVCKENPQRPKKSRADAYSEKVQDTVYDLILEGKTAREVSHKLGIPEPVLSKWIHEWLDDGLIVVTRHGHSNTYAEAGKKPVDELPAPVKTPAPADKMDPADETTIEQLKEGIEKAIEIELEEQEEKDETHPVKFSKSAPPRRVQKRGELLPCQFCGAPYGNVAMHEPCCVKNPDRGAKRVVVRAVPMDRPAAQSVQTPAHQNPTAAAVPIEEPSDPIEKRIANVVMAAELSGAGSASFFIRSEKCDIRIEISRRQR
jgi:transposase-like protein/DNA-binding PadR family transcriptional regulator